MKKDILILIPLTALLCFSCKKREIHTETLNMDSIKEIHINTSPTSYCSTTLYPKNCFFIKDSFLVVFEPKNQNNFIHVYNNDTKKIIARFGQIGKGGYDFINPRLITNNIPAKSNEFIIGDTRRICKINIDSLLLNKNYKGEDYADIPDELRLYNYILYCSDSLIIVNQTGKKQLTFWDRNKEKAVHKNILLRNENLKVTDLCLTMGIYDAYYTSNGERIAIAYKNWKQIDIVSLSGDIVKRVYFPNYLFNQDKVDLYKDKQNIEFSKDAHLFFTYVASTSKYLYALCWNNTKENIKKGKAFSQIYQLDWDGNLVNIYSFDRAISSFCVFKDNITYAIGVSERNLDLNIYNCNYINTKN